MLNALIGLVLLLRCYVFTEIIDISSSLILSFSPGEWIRVINPNADADRTNRNVTSSGSVTSVSVVPGTRGCGCSFSTPPVVCVDREREVTRGVWKVSERGTAAAPGVAECGGRAATRPLSPQPRAFVSGADESMFVARSFPCNEFNVSPGPAVAPAVVGRGRGRRTKHTTTTTSATAATTAATTLHQQRRTAPRWTIPPPTSAVPGASRCLPDVCHRREQSLRSLYVGSRPTASFALWKLLQRATLLTETVVLADVTRPHRKCELSVLKPGITQGKLCPYSDKLRSNRFIIVI